MGRPAIGSYTTLAAVLLAIGSLCGCGSSSPASGGASAVVAPVAPPVAPQVTTQPVSQTVTVAQSATFSVVATGTAPLSYQWSKDGTAIAGATAASYTTPAAIAADNGSTFSVLVSNTAGNATSSSATLEVTAAPSGTDVATYKNDVARTGQNLTESILTPTNVNSTSFGLLRILAVDGKVDAQPLYLSHLTVGGSLHNVLYVATENNSVYAFDADTGAQLWKVSLIEAAETTSDTHACGQIAPSIGITATPVIDRGAAVLYVVAMTEDLSANYHQRLHALSITSGAESANSPVEIRATWGSTSFVPSQYSERAALLLSNGVVYTTWTSHCDDGIYGGWIIGYNESTLTQAGVLNVGPGAGGTGYQHEGPAIWMSGGGPAADAAGNLYLLTGNGAFETTLDGNGFPSGGDYGNSFLKLSASGSILSVSQYFAMSNEVDESTSDTDLGSGGEMLLPDMTDSGGTIRHLVVGAGKDGNLYIVSRDSMGGFNPASNDIWQELDNVTGGVFGTPAYFNGSVYYGSVGAPLKAFPITNARLSATPSSISATSFRFPGTAPAITANGVANGIVWTHENASPGVLHAYDATNLAKELYNSNQAPNGRDQFGPGNKFITPMISGGKVFLGTQVGVAVFGLLN
jgi:outer membrane protein assembly factor BamB